MVKVNNPALENFYKVQEQNTFFYGLMMPDKILFFCLFLLLMVGLVMVGSSSMPKAGTIGDSLAYLDKQIVFLCIGLFLAGITFCIPLSFLYKNSRLLLIIGILLLIAVLIPGIGRRVNGAMRWIPIGSINVQASEVVRICLIVYTAAFLTRNQNQIQKSFVAMGKLIFVLGLVCSLLLLQPDFGVSVVCAIIVLGMLFLAGVCLVRFSIATIAVFLIGAFVLLSKSYRVNRLFSFREPFKDAYGDGYQLVQSLIAIGRGETFGVGIGGSIQKHHYLPEAHTDFIFSILAEETGLIGAVLLIFLYMIVVWRAFMIASLADSVRMRFGSCIAYGIGIWIAFQSLVNMSVASGLLPTKGLTLPFISYGGSSIVASLILFAILFRVDSEARFLAHRESIRKAAKAKLEI